MMSLGRWRWPLIVLLPLSALAGLIWHSDVRPVFESSVTLGWTGGAVIPPAELSRISSQQSLRVVRIPGHPLDIILTAQADRPKDASAFVHRSAQAAVAGQLVKQKSALHKQATALDARIAELSAHEVSLKNDFIKALRPARPGTSKPNPALLAELENLKNRRHLLIERFPLHPEIPQLALQIQKLQAQARARPSARPDRSILPKMGRAMAELRIQIDMLTLQKQALTATEPALRSAWVVRPGVQEPRWPGRVEGWPLGAGVLAGLFLIGFFVTRTIPQERPDAFADGLWRMPSAIPLAVVPSDDKELQKAPWQVPEDPASQEAASLYDQWLALVKDLYEPAPTPPQGILEIVDPLLQKTFQFLSAGQEALSRCLARTIKPGELTSHVAHTVLMALIGTMEAGASQEHGRAMALAALFHDLALVPRPATALQDVGSEIGRLSAVLVPKIPGLTPTLTVMIQDILVGMDEFKQSMWQNVPPETNFEPLANLLRQVDRFEKVMQKQSIRVQRRLTQRVSV